MADFNVGDVTARLRADSTQFTQAITEAIAKLGQLDQATATLRQQQSQSLQASQQQAQAYRGVATAAQQTTQATMQATAGQRGLAQAFQQATQATAQSTTALHAQQAVLQQTTQATTQASTGFRAMLSVAGGIGIATGVGALAGQLKDLAVNAVQVGTRFEALRASLSALGGSTTAGIQQFQMLVTMAQQLGVAFEPLARGWRTLTAAASQAGLPLADQQRLLAAMATEGRRVGASNEELGRAITAMAQIASKGKVQMEELRGQLGEALPTALAAAALGMGKTTEELLKLVESGVSFGPFAKAFTRGLEQMQASSKDLGTTSQQAFNQLETAWKQLLDAVMNNGLNKYLTTVIGNFKNVFEAATEFLNRNRTTVAIGPQRADIGIAPNSDLDQQIKTLENRIAAARTGVEGARTTQRKEELGRIVTELESQRTVLMESAQATQLQADAQGKVAAEANKAKSVLEQQADFTENIRKKLAETLKLQADARKEAALAPEYLGTLKGTPDQIEESRKAAQKVLATQLDALTKFAAAPPEGVTLDKGQEAQIRALSKEYGVLAKAIDDAKDATRAQAKAARDLATEQKAAVTQAIQLDATLERLQGLTRRPDENKAEEAATRVRTQYAGAVAEAEKMIVALERSKSLQAARPEALEQYRALRDALRETGEAQAKLAADEVLKRQIAPLEEIALRYGAVTLEITSQSDHVQELASKYGLATKEAIDLAKAEELAASFTGTARQEAAEKYLKTIQDTIEARQAIEAQVPRLEQEALASFGPGAAAVRDVGVTTDLESQLERLRAPREERVSTRARQQATRKGGVLTPEQEALLAQIREQERVNAIMQVAERIGDQAAQTITDGLLKIVDGTVKVADGFKQMAKSIIDSFAQILISESLRGLIRLGLGVLFGALSAGAGAGAAVGDTTAVAAGSGVGDIGIGTTLGAGFRFQHGGVVSKPTYALIGENPATSPETILTRQQMQGLMSSAMQAAPSAGGQAAGTQAITIINVASREQAKAEQAREQAMGRQVVVNYVLDELSQGSGSRIGRLIRSGG